MEIKTNTMRNGILKGNLCFLQALPAILLTVPILNNYYGEQNSFELIFYSISCTILYGIAYLASYRLSLPKIFPIWYYSLLILVTLWMAFSPVCHTKLLFGFIVVSFILVFAMWLIGIRNFEQLCKEEFARQQLQILCIGIVPSAITFGILRHAML